jgi:diguanylate cyclase (GGDEF)-like protein/PAS domain S-box-containing protein
LAQNWLDTLHPDDQDEFIAKWITSLSTKTPFFSKSRLQNTENNFEWFDIRANPHETNEGKNIRWLCSATNIHQLELIHRALADSESQFHACFYHSPVPMVLITESGFITKHNLSFHKLLGNPDNNDEYIYKIEDILSGDQLQDHQRRMQELLSAADPYIQYETRYLAQDGHSVPVLVYAAVISLQEASRIFLLQISDLTDSKNRERALIQLAHFDTLTKLINRSKLNEELDFLVSRFDRHKIPFAMLFGDIDNFKQINDGFGHEVGDYVLKIVARRFRKILRQDDLIARLGGDEFVIIIDGINRYEIVASIANKLLGTLAKPIRIIGGRKLHISMSFGIALFPADGPDSATLLRNADSALYEAKNNGRGQFQLYRRELTEFVHNRLQLDTDLRKAITSNQFELYFQPVVNLSTNKIVSAEALIRWHHPTRGLVMPGEFISYAEESDMINRIGNWVIQDAGRCIAEINQMGVSIPIAVNLSVRQFQQTDLFSQFTKVFHQYNLTPEQFTLEITEQLLLEKTELNLQQVSKLKEAGFRISLDDFGVGYSSLSYIIRFAPDQLKVDHSFVSQIGEAREHDGMVRAIIGLSKIMPMKIVAEGVETDRQKWFLIENGCDYAQGYLFYQPMPLNNLLSILRQQILH